MPKLVNCQNKGGFKLRTGRPAGLMSRSGLQQGSATALQVWTKSWGEQLCTTPQVQQIVTFGCGLPLVGR